MRKKLFKTVFALYRAFIAAFVAVTLAASGYTVYESAISTPYGWRAVACGIVGVIILLALICAGALLYKWLSEQVE